MIKKITVSIVLLAVSLTLSARGMRPARPAMPAPPRGVSVPSAPKPATGNAYRPPQHSVRPPQQSVRPPQPVHHPKPVNPKPVPDKRPPYPPGPHKPGHRPPPRPKPPVWHDRDCSGCVPVVPVVYYGDVPTDYSYAWYNDRYVIYWRGWFWYKNAWVWGGQGKAPDPPNWRPR